MRYKEVLKKYGVTQSELAEKLGINRVSVSRLLSDNNNMRASTILKIANAIGCKAGELFEEPDEGKTSVPSIICPHCGKEINLKVEK
ncbi:MAG: helix-turn-helix transcriptional regulator [Prevotella sp.]|jgi:transcriptional regulator with XRE-family HTH domain|nr:helix-turn-helix transcriptional regulator [Prevotella sp.]